MRLFKKVEDYFVKSYSQCGEDIIINYIFSSYLKYKKITYIDIGANHPMHFSNTFFFYEKGNSGICIEPDPYLFKDIKKRRGKDICLNIGIGIDEKIEADFYIMECRTLNTLSREEAERYDKECGKKIEEIIKIPLVNINEVISEHLNESPNLISLDVEGIDYEILESFDFSKYRPEVFCIETINFSEDRNQQSKNSKIIEFMKSKDYFVYADTFINTIFVDKICWQDNER